MKAEWLCERLQTGEFSIRHCAGRVQLADLLTKVMTWARIRELLLLWSFNVEEDPAAVGMAQAEASSQIQHSRSRSHCTYHNLAKQQGFWQSCYCYQLSPKKYRYRSGALVRTAVTETGLYVVVWVAGGRPCSPAHTGMGAATLGRASNLRSVGTRVVFAKATTAPTPKRHYG